MIDITSSNGGDLGLFDTDIERAKNLLSIQIGALEYLPDFGIDLKYFLQEGVEFQNESFKAYLIQRMASYNINVTGVLEVVNALFESLTFSIGNRSTGDGLVAR